MTLYSALFIALSSAGWIAIMWAGSRQTSLTTAAPDERTHATPESPPTVTEAHKLMQQHMECDIDTCGAKAAAFDMLVDVCHIVPDRSYIMHR
jgi:hypothetical protein